MSSPILASQEVSSQTKILASSIHFGRPYGCYWGATSIFLLHSILKPMAKKRLSTESWCILSELTLGAANNGTITCTFSSIDTTRQHILLHDFHLLKSSWASNHHLQLISHSLGLLKVPSINSKNNCQLQQFLQQIAQCHSAVTSALKAAHDHAKKCQEKQRTFMAFQPGDQVWLHLDKNSSKATITSFFQSDMVCIQYLTRLEKMHIGWIYHHNWESIMSLM
jgi:hypothetical protein